MTDQTSKIELFKTRSLLGRLSASFKFMNDNLSIFLRLGTYIALPTTILVALYCALFMSKPVAEQQSLGYIVSTIALGVILVIGVCVFCSLVYTLIQKYVEDGYLPQYHLKDLKKLLLENTKKVFLVGLVTFVIGIILMLILVSLAYLTLYTLILTIPLIIFVLIPLSYTVYIYILEKTSLIVAFRKSYQLGIRTWGSIFAVGLITAFLVGIIQTIAALPWSMALMVNNLANIAWLRGEEVILPGFFPFLMFFLAFVAILISFLGNIMQLIPMAFQYASAEESRRERELLQNDNQSL